jgi:hypothetical protein
MEADGMEWADDGQLQKGDASSHIRSIIWLRRGEAHMEIQSDERMIGLKVDDAW